MCADGALAWMPGLLIGSSQLNMSDAFSPLENPGQNARSV